MPKAAARPTPPAPDTATSTETLASVETPLVTSLPTIHNLGRRIAALYVVHDRCDEEDIKADGFAAEHRALRARTLSGQQGEVAISVSVLNRMIQTGKPISVRA